MLGFNFFFLPPAGTWTIADPQNWVAVLVFPAVSLVASRLSHVARARTREAAGRRDELARLFDLSREVLAAAGRPVEPGTLDTLGGVVAIAIERMQFLKERKTADLARQREELKTTLLASLSPSLTGADR